MTTQHTLHFMLHLEVNYGLVSACCPRLTLKPIPQGTTHQDEILAADGHVMSANFSSLSSVETA